MIDTHTHLNFADYQLDWREIVERAVQAGVTKIIVVGTDLVSSKKAVEMASEHPALFACVGVHPHHARGIINLESGIKDVERQLTQLSKKPKVVAIGEVGLDNHRYKKSRYQITDSEKKQN